MGEGKKLKTPLCCGIYSEKSYSNYPSHAESHAFGFLESVRHPTYIYLPIYVERGWKLWKNSYHFLKANTYITSFTLRYKHQPFIQRHIAHTDTPLYHAGTRINLPKSDFFFRRTWYKIPFCSKIPVFLTRFLLVIGVRVILNTQIRHPSGVCGSGYDW